MASRAFVRDSLGLALSQYVARAMMLARGIAAAAALGPVGFGAWNALILILDYGAYASFGALQGLDLALPPAAARGDRATARRVLRGAWWVTLAGGGLFVAGVAAYLASGSWISLSGWGWGAPALMLVAALLQLAVLYDASALRAFGDFAAVSGGLTLQAVVGGGIGLATVWRFGVWGLLWGWLAGGVIGLAWMRRSPHRPPLRPAHPDEGAALAVVGLPMFAFFGLALVLRSLDRIALVRFGGNDALGFYSLGLIASGLVLYIPEAAAAVLFPRVAAAAGGARDPDTTRRQVLRAQRALTALLPLLAGAALPWAAPVVARLLPAFEGGLASMRVLVIASLVMSIATLPSYYLLGLGLARSLLVWAAGAAAVAAVAIFVTASRDPRPEAVAWAATVGAGCFAGAMLWRAAPRLAPNRAERAWLVLGALIPVAWGAALILWLARGSGSGVRGAATASGWFVLADLPVAWIFTRGLGIVAALFGRGRE